MTQIIGYHPQRLHSTTQLHPSQVLEDVTSYLDAASSNPSLHPDAQLTESGPVTVSNGESLGLALHHLQRLQSGLRGERLVPDATIRSSLLSVRKGKGRLKNVAAASDSEDQQGWQDREEFDREQEVSDGHAEGTAPPVVREEAAIRNGDPRTESSTGAVQSADTKSRKGKRKDESEPGIHVEGNAESKALRKKLKKERSKAERRAKAEKQKGSEDE
jgi:hypothetical protein